MKILVPVKRVADHRMPVRVRPDGSGLETDGLRYEMNPFDEIALEAALRMREAGECAELVIVSCGTSEVQEVLRHGLALGADRAVHVHTDAPLQPLAVARLLKALALIEAPQLILAGKQAVDDDAAQTGPMLAAMLGWPQACFASEILLQGDRVEVDCETDEGSERLALDLPALVTVDLRLNVPRFATLANTMKARRRTLEEIPATDLVRDPGVRVHTEHFARPVTRARGESLASAAGLAARLRAFTGMTEGAQ